MLFMFNRVVLYIYQLHTEFHTLIESVLVGGTTITLDPLLKFYILQWIQIFEFKHNSTIFTQESMLHTYIQK